MLKAHRFFYHSTLGSRIIKKKKRRESAVVGGGTVASGAGLGCAVQDSHHNSRVLTCRVRFQRSICAMNLPDWATVRAGGKLPHFKVFHDLYLKMRPYSYLE